MYYLDMDYGDYEYAIQAMANALPEILFTADWGGNIDFYNNYWYKFTGLEPGSLALPEQWQRIVHPDDLAKTIEIWSKALASGEQAEIECRLRPQNSELYKWFIGRVFPLKNKQGQIIKWVGRCSDIDSQKRAEETIKFQLMHDPLTKLPNRSALEELLSMGLNIQQNSHKMIALLFLDMDRFKNINEILGHDIGDLVLKEVSIKLNSLIRKQDAVARFGGDEFIILLNEISSAQSVATVAQKILNELARPIKIREHTIHLTASCGISVYPIDGVEMPVLLRNAETALSRAKEGGRNKYQLFNASMNIQALQKYALENELREALELNQFVLYYQPIIEAKSNKIFGAEALLRWNHPKLGLIYPNEFIRIAEESGFILSLNDWVVNQACAQRQAWNKAELPEFKVLVNISPRNFEEKGFANSIADALRRNHLDGRQLGIEITESAAIKNIERTVHTLSRLKEIKVNVTIDDFGVGYSSLNYLKRFSFSKLKIDRSFIKNCVVDPQDNAIVKTIIQLAKNMQMKVIAEGIENKAQLDFLRGLDCDYLQGFFIARPVPPEAILARASQNSPIGR